MQIVKQNKILRVMLAVFAAVIIVLSVALTVFSVKNNRLSESGAQAYESLSEALGSEQSARAQEASSYQAQIDAQNKAHQSEKDALQQTIADLNRQISTKRAASTQPPVTQSPAVQTGTADLSGKTVYLTFDDGPSPRTPEILKILDQYGVKATFFVINGGKYNQYMKDIVNGGHSIALHSYSHNYSNIYASEENYFADLQKISDVVYEQTGVRSNLIRFPGGSSNTVSRKYSKGIMTRLTKEVAARGYVYFDWNVESGDAAGNRVSAQTIINNCRKVPRNNAVIVLMHDASPKKSTVEALPAVIEYYKKAGCKFAALTTSSPVVHQRVLN